MGNCRIFSGGAQIRRFGDGSPSAGFRGGACSGYLEAAKPPEVNDMF